MIQKLKLLILSFSSLIIFAAPLAIAPAAMADNPINQNDINSNLQCGSNGDFQLGNCNSDIDTPDKTVNNLITTIINILSIVVGIIAVIMIIIAGLRYVTSGGKEEGVKGAKNTILYAIIGLVIVALAQIIVHFVLNKTTTATTS